MSQSEPGFARRVSLYDSDKIIGELFMSRRNEEFQPLQVSLARTRSHALINEKLSRAKELAEAAVESVIKAFALPESLSVNAKAEAGNLLNEEQAPKSLFNGGQTPLNNADGANIQKKKEGVLYSAFPQAGLGEFIAKLESSLEHFTKKAEPAVSLFSSGIDRLGDMGGRVKTFFGGESGGTAATKLQNKEGGTDISNNSESSFYEAPFAGDSESLEALAPFRTEGEQALGALTMLFGGLERVKAVFDKSGFSDIFSEPLKLAEMAKFSAVAANERWQARESRYEGERSERESTVSTTTSTTNIGEVTIHTGANAKEVRGALEDLTGNRTAGAY